MVCFVKYGLLFGEKVKRATDFAIKFGFAY
jgi:hypothetical protein